MSPIITVIGATGIQGGGVIDAAVKAGIYKVRAITRNADSEKAKALATRGVEVVVADLGNEDSLVKAFEGSSYVFAVTDFFEPFASSGCDPDVAMKAEIDQGTNIINALSKTATLKHFIFSTLPHSEKVSNGKYVVPHFDAKAKIDIMIKEKAELHAKTTFLWVAWYATNYLFPMFTPNFTKSSGKYVQIQCTPPTTPLFSIGNAGINVGVFALNIFAKPEVSLPGKYVLAYNQATTIGDLLKDWSLATGKPSVYVQTSLEDFDAVWPKWGYEMGVMMKFLDEFGDKAWATEPFVVAKDLKITDKLVTIDETYKSMDWSFLG